METVRVCLDCHSPIGINGCACTPFILNPRSPAKPTPPPLRIIREGEATCWKCGGGRASHQGGALGHPFARGTRYEKPTIPRPLSLPAACLILGVSCGVILGLLLSALLRHAWN